MRDDGLAWRNILIALAAVALFTIGLGIIVYVGIARERLMPKPTLVAQGSPRPSLSVTPWPSETPQPLATVVGIVREYSPGALIIVLEPREGNVEQVIVPENIEVSWADGRRASPREIVPGQELFAEGPLDALGRMIAQRIVITKQAIPTQTASPVPPEPTATPTPANRWLAEYYGNRTLSGSPVLIRYDPKIDFRWQQGAPAPGMPADNFSVRWRGRWAFDEGGYRFYAYSDDGVRLWVDGVLVINQWKNQSPTLSYGDLYLKKGEHIVQVEYFEGVDNAEVRVWWDFRGAYPDWRAEYFANPDLSGDPVLVRNDVAVAFDWGAASPAPEVPADRFSVRWTRTVQLEEGPYRFRARADDGVRLWVDSVPVIDEWHESTPMIYDGYLLLDGGPHQLRIEYYENGGDAFVQVWWEKITSFTHWKGEYYANPDLAGRPVFIRDDEQLDFNWDKGSPGKGIPVDNFSIRWSRTLSFEPGEYRFVAYADDGVRVYVDGQLVIDEWRDSPAEWYEGVLSLDRGKHQVVVEYYERGDQAIIKVGWELVPTPTPTLTETATPTWTATPITPTPTRVTPTFTPTPSSTPTREATPTPSATGTSTSTPTPPPPSLTPTKISPTPLPSATSALTPSPTATSTLRPSPTWTATATQPVPSDTPTHTPSPLSPSVTPTYTLVPKPSMTPEDYP